MSRIGVIGLARSGRAAAKLALKQGHSVYATDSGDAAELQSAAAELRAQGARVDVGMHDMDQLASCDVIVVSPGIPPTATVLRDPRVARVQRISELEFAARSTSTPMIVITGTNGKSTTTALASHLLVTCGFDAPAAGNIGTALSEVVLNEEQPDWVVVEASSFQLADIDTLKPTIGVVTNLAPDHLDRYESVEAYYGDKARLFDNADADSIWVLNAEDEAVMALPGEADGARLVFRVNTQLGATESGGFIDDGGNLTVRMNNATTRLVHRTELRILGAHNEANALAAAVAVMSAGADATGVADGLRTFGGLEHRLEVVGDFDDVRWINDSKATNVDSTLVAVRSMTRPTVLLLGGRHKGEAYTRLGSEIARTVRTVIAFGEAAGEVEKDLGATSKVVRVDGDFSAVVDRAREIAQRGDVVLLSPACSSYDMFRNYEERGNTFKQLARGAR
jgi:UDP-N-acetylmuramoylalanine--D-glutamate ligase